LFALDRQASSARVHHSALAPREIAGHSSGGRDPTTRGFNEWAQIYAVERQTLCKKLDETADKNPARRAAVSELRPPGDSSVHLGLAPCAPFDFDLRPEVPFGFRLIRIFTCCFWRIANPRAGNMSRQF